MAASTALQVLVSPLLGTVYDSLRSVIENEFIQISGVGEEFQRLSDILLTVEDVLEDAEVKQLKEKPIRNWLRKLKDVAYDVEDFLDECAIMGVRTAQDNLKCSSRFYHIQEFLTGSVPSILSIEPSSSSSHTIAERIERFIDKFDAIAEQRYKFHLNPYVAVADPQSRMKQLRETTSKLINEQQDFSLPSPSSSRSSAYPCLRTLKIKNCPKLRFFFSLPSSIQVLDLQESHEMVVLKSFEKLPSCLSHLKITRFPHLVSFPVEEEEEEELGSLSNLIYLQVWECPNLKALPRKFIKNLTSLTDFKIAGCHMLTQLPEGMHNISSLKLLWIEHCGSLMSLNRGLQNLTKLENLRICNCPRMKFFPDDFQNLSSLSKLNLEGLPNVAELPALVVGGSASSSQQHISTTLPTLKEMTIRYCSGLTRLPEWICYLPLVEALEFSYCKNLQFLPDGGLQRLTALDGLRIKNCHPNLHGRCEKDTGEYWDKISHIKHLLIESVELPSKYSACAIFDAYFDQWNMNSELR
ncbi:hypothetical protein MKW92_037181 [Papaver armeniacum]|nr:hypothetical protein MKW92_037181 [Papaver armeniacum]